MKKNLFFLMLFMGLNVVTASPFNNLPEKVKRNFQTMFPAAEDVDFSEEDGEITVFFYENGLSKEAVFNSEGNWVETTTTLTEDELPPSILDYLENKLGDEDYLENLLKVDRKNLIRYLVNYLADEEGRTLTFDENGKLLSNK